MIYTQLLSNGVTKYVVRIQRHGKRQVLGRFVTPNEAVSCEIRNYAAYLADVWLRGKEKSTNDPNS